MEITHEMLHLENRKFGTATDHYTPTSFIWIIIFFYGAFEYGNGVKFWDLLGQTLNPFVYNSVILYNVIPLKTV
jgi:hypothetical protein